MFKVSIEEIDKTTEEEIIIKCHEVNNDILSLVDKIKNNDNKPNTLTGIKDDNIYQIKLKDIYYIEATENKTFIYLSDDFYESKLKLYEIEEKLRGLSFFRCSKSIILHYSKIECVTPAFNGRFEAKLKNGEKVIISRQYVPILKGLLGL